MPRTKLQAKVNAEDARKWQASRFNGQMRAAMAETKTTCPELAKACGINERVLRNRLEGNNEWKLSEMLRATAYMGVSLSQLMQRVEVI